MPSSKNVCSYEWTGLDDPAALPGRKVTLRAEESGWLHFCIQSGHMIRRSEIFDAWFGKALCEQLRNAWKMPVDTRHELIQQAGQAMDSEIRHTLGAPIVLVYECSGAGGGKKGEFWRLPLKNGVRLVARRIRHHAILVTCFPPDVMSRVMLAEYRWVVELRTIVQMYADRQGKHFLLPKENRVVNARHDGKAVRHHSIRFRSPLNWGFQDSVPGALWSPPSCYPIGHSSSHFSLAPRAKLQD